MYTYIILFLCVSFSSLLWTDENILVVKTSRSAVCVSCDCVYHVTVSCDYVYHVTVSCDCVYHLTVYHVTVYHVTVYIMWLCIMWLCVSCDCVSCDYVGSGHFHDKNNNFRIKIFYRSPVPQCSMYTYILFLCVSFTSLLWTWTDESILMVKTSRSAVCVSCDCITWLCHFISPHRTPNQNTDQILGRS